MSEASPAEIDKNPFGCPQCHSYGIYRSRLRGWERVKKYFTIERPYRCHDCGWRGWLENIRYANYPLPTSERPPRNS
jgi:predicted RNA-binding Zn-ribbon protein involved in translation (DUF1610 family)